MWKGVWEKWMEIREISKGLNLPRGRLSRMKMFSIGGEFCHFAFGTKSSLLYCHSQVWVKKIRLLLAAQNIFRFPAQVTDMGVSPDGKEMNVNDNKFLGKIAGVKYVCGKCPRGGHFPGDH
jgi:hypothetical protein